ncbi:hypothetical protein [Paenibacillus xylanexedens]|uniref:hypothetical protein n=1 Tax=Paenibacillus xylanexedens TaxID=528191 RepID=UPI003CFF0F72
MDFTKGKRRAYERMMKEKPGFSRHEQEDERDRQYPSISSSKKKTGEQEKYGKEDA